MNPATEVAMIEWTQGERRLGELEERLTRSRRDVLEAVVRELADELRRRVGSTFTLDELAAEYQSAAAWCLDVAQRTTDQSFAHDLSVVEDAAFARFARSATDYR